MDRCVRLDAAAWIHFGSWTATGSPAPNGVTPGATIWPEPERLPACYVFDLIATDSIGVQARRTFTLSVTGINILPGSPRNATTGVAYSEQFTPVGGTAPYTFSMTPSSLSSDMLPPGLSFSSSGAISGTPTSTGNYGFVLHLQDSNGLTFARTYSFTVNNAFGLRVTSNTPFDRQIGSAGTVVSLGTSGASTCTTWSIVRPLPAGLRADLTRRPSPARRTLGPNACSRARDGQRQRGEDFAGSRSASTSDAR